MEEAIKKPKSHETLGALALQNRFEHADRITATTYSNKPNTRKEAQNV
jgi:hypothetical protein